MPQRTIKRYPKQLRAPFCYCLFFSVQFPKLYDQPYYQTSLVLPARSEQYALFFISTHCNFTSKILHTFKCKIAVCSAASTREVDWFNKVNVFVLFNGKVHFKIRSDFTTVCSLQMSFFPFDKQRCNLDAGVQEFSSYQVNLTNGNLTLGTTQVKTYMSVSLHFKKRRVPPSRYFMFICSNT